jgi:UDP-N-acetylmuramoyl-tripeptide--D-alanyl-D-alanine ligase
MIWTIDEILQATGGQLMHGAGETTFEGVGIDSRTIESGRLFVAIRGEKYDGHAFIDQVVAKGIKGLVVMADATAAAHHDQWRARGIVCIGVADTTRALGALAAFQRARSRIPVVAITGSNGKTTTRQMTSLVMAQRFNTLSTQGNFNNEIGLPLTLFHLTREHQAAVLELGMNHPGEISRLGAICRPTIGMITNVGPGHLEFLHSLKGVAQAKAELIPCIDPHGTVVLNQDNALVAAMARDAGRPVLFFGTSEGAHVRARQIHDTDSGVSFELLLPDGAIAVALKTPGRFMVANALAAAAAGHLAGLSPSDIKVGLEAFTPAKGRLHIVSTALGVSIIDDTYNANPASMAAALDTFEALRGTGPGTLILADMLELGAQADTLHREVGMLAGKTGAGRLYIHGPHAEVVRQGAEQAGMARSAIFVGTKEEIVADAIRHLTAAHWVLVKGSRGMAMEAVVEAIRRWADGVQR